ncbi:MAG: four helix bundle protein [Acidobacteria bacterium]|nr:four helix bundle protein [Acidobacteriota bacterium]MBI3425826.1 four helix bundle protein [Acidobacteriota bacterium]
MAIQSYRDLKVWQKGMELVAACYAFTQRLPESEAFGLTADIRRRVRQVPASIADGHGRGNSGEYLSRLSFAHGTLMALETDLHTVNQLGLLPLSEIQPLLQQSAELGKMLNGLMRSLRGGRPDS